MPNDNVERAIKKATGALAGAAMEEIQYEGYAPGGVAVIVHVLTDNRNRTAAEVRTIFNRHNANLGGSVAWMFHRKCRFVVEGENANEEKLLEVLLDAGADVDDVLVTDGSAEIVGKPNAFGDVVGALERAGIAVSESGVVLSPETTVPLATREEARKVLRFIEALEEYEDVQAVFSNLEIPDAVLEQLASEV
jgi:YebC/PmpR family DNA-binding regulatory protein